MNSSTGKRRRESRGVRATVWFPPVVLDMLDQIAKLEGCSRSWLITELVCQQLEIDESRINEARGYAIPKRFEDRVGNWSPKKKKGKGHAKIMGVPIEYTCKVCGEPVRLSENTPKEVVDKLDSRCLKCSTIEKEKGGEQVV